MVCKKEQAELAIEMQERMSSYIGIKVNDRDPKGRVTKRSALIESEIRYREKLYLKVKELNRKGNIRQERIENNLQEANYIRWQKRNVGCKKPFEEKGLSHVGVKAEVTKG